MKRFRAFRHYILNDVVETAPTGPPLPFNGRECQRFDQERLVTTTLGVSLSMNPNGRVLGIHFIVLTVALSAASLLAAQEQRGFLSLDAKGAAAAAAQHDQTIPAECRGPVSLVTDVGFEGLKTTAFNFSNTTGGGESGRFDKTPVLSTKIHLEERTCLNAHFSALVGGAQTYSGVSPLTMFQVTLTNVSTGGAPQHMYGHWETPYGLYGPAVAIEAERDVDEIGANFFQRVGFEKGDVPPGDYLVDVWWSGGPNGTGGAIGAAFVLKLYSGKN
jgi:hypothetical protein